MHSRQDAGTTGTPVADEGRKITYAAYYAALNSRETLQCAKGNEPLSLLKSKGAVPRCPRRYHWPESHSMAA